MKPDPNHLGYAVMHILRFKDNKIIEMWDFGQEVPAEMPNENGMFQMRTLVYRGQIRLGSFINTKAAK